MRLPDRLRLYLMQQVNTPDQFIMPVPLENHCTTGSQDAMLNLLMNIYQKKGRWTVLSLDTISDAVAEASKDQSRHNTFRSLPDRVMEHGLRGLCINGLLRENGRGDRLHKVKYVPTRKFFKSIRVFHTTWRPYRTAATCTR